MVVNLLYSAFLEPKLNDSLQFSHMTSVFFTGYILFYANLFLNFVVIRHKTVNIIPNEKIILSFHFVGLFYFFK